MFINILVYSLYFSTYTILLALAGLWCFEECAATDEEEYVFQYQQRVLLY